MSPEQVRGLAIDRRNRRVLLWGWCLWEMTTGRRLFRVDSDLATLGRVEACIVPPPSALCEGLSVRARGRGAQGIAARVFGSLPNRSRTLARSAALLDGLEGGRGAPSKSRPTSRKLFSDRVRKRDEHLRWAAEVTQTISIRKSADARTLR